MSCKAAPGLRSGSHWLWSMTKCQPCLPSLWRKACGQTKVRSLSVFLGILLWKHQRTQRTFDLVLCKSDCQIKQKAILLCEALRLQPAGSPNVCCIIWWQVTPFASFCFNIWAGNRPLLSIFVIEEYSLTVVKAIESKQPQVWVANWNHEQVGPSLQSLESDCEEQLPQKAKASSPRAEVRDLNCGKLQTSLESPHGCKQFQLIVVDFLQRISKPVLKIPKAPPWRLCQDDRESYLCSQCLHMSPCMSSWINEAPLLGACPSGGCLPSQEI